jgi:hypothetical protein
MDRGPYAFFDAVVVITLRDREDRRASAERHLRALGLAGTRFFVADRHPRGGRVGCMDSHVRVAEQCLADPGCRTALVFEDDFRPAPAYSEGHVARAVRFMRERADWDVFMLGYNPLTLLKPASRAALDWLGAEEAAPGIVRHPGAATHAYCLNRRSMRALVGAGRPLLDRIDRGLVPPQDVPTVDLHLMNSLFARTTYCIVPLQFDQHLCLPTDNEPLNTKEVILRRFACAAERTEAVHFLVLARTEGAMLAAAAVAALALLALVLLAARRAKM